MDKTLSDHQAAKKLFSEQSRAQGPFEERSVQFVMEECRVAVDLKMDEMVTDPGIVDFKKKLGCGVHAFGLHIHRLGKP